MRGLPADFQCAPQGTLRDVGLGVVGAVGGRESEHERKFEKRASGTSAPAACTRALLGLKLAMRPVLDVFWLQMAPSVPR